MGTFIGKGRYSKRLGTRISSIYHYLVSDLWQRGLTESANTELKALVCTTEQMDDLASIGLLDSATLISTPTVYNEGWLKSVKNNVSPSDVVVNGDFATDSDWTKQADWTISGGKANCSTTGTDHIYQDAGLVVGKTYRITYDVTDYTSGQIRVEAAVSSNQGIYRTGVGTYSEDFTITSATLNRPLFRNSASGFVGSIDNVIVKDISTDLAWTRASDATRINAEGNLETVPYNLVGYSEEFDNGYWSKNSGVTVTPDFSTAPDGKMTAERYENTGSGSGVFRRFLFDSGGTYTLSFYVKSNTGTTQSVRLRASDFLYGSDLSVTTEWTRVDLIVVADGSNGAYGLYKDSLNTDLDILFWGAQLVKGSVAKPYFPTTDRLDVPRITYGNFDYITTYGDEDVVNGNFATDTDWAKDFEWTIAGGKATNDGGGFSIINTIGNVFTVGRTYKVSFDVSGMTTGSVTQPADGTNSSGADVTANGSYTTTYLKLPTGSLGCWIYALGGFDGSIDNVSVREVFEDTPVNGCPSTLLEPQRTNLFTYSNDFTNGVWTKTRSNITANDETSVWGVDNASAFIEDTSITTSHYLRNVTVTGLVATTVYTASMFVKANGRDDIRLYLIDSTISDGASARFNLSTGVASSLLASGTGTNIDSSIEYFGNGWYKISITTAMNNGKTQGGIQLSIYDNGSASYTGDGVSGIYISDFQLEAGAYPTMPIPTVASQVTRLRDKYSVENVYTNGLITASGGAWMIELENNVELTRDVNSSGLFLGSGTVGNVDSISIKALSGIKRLNIAYHISSGLTNLYQTTTDNCKLVINWNGTTLDVFENGVKVVAGEAFTFTAFKYFISDARNVPYYIKQNILYPAPLTEEQALSLSSLYSSYTEMALDLNFNLILDA